jgi:hypothetical protein
MKKTRSTRPSLQLKKETLQALQAGNLVDVLGGGTVSDKKTVCLTVCWEK